LGVKDIALVMLTLSCACLAEPETVRDITAAEVK